MDYSTVSHWFGQDNPATLLAKNVRGLPFTLLLGMEEIWIPLSDKKN